MTVYAHGIGTMHPQMGAGVEPTTHSPNVPPKLHSDLAFPLSLVTFILRKRAW